jgi:hypothetical protein
LLSRVRSIAATFRAVSRNGFSTFSKCFTLSRPRHWDLCENLNNVIGHGIWFDTYQVQNTEMLWFVNEIIETMNSDNMLCGCFGLYPSYVAGILNRMPNIHFYLVCSEKINFEDYIKKCVANKECTISNVDDTLRMLSRNVIKVSFEQIVVRGKLLSERSPTMC